MGHREADHSKGAIVRQHIPGRRVSDVCRETAWPRHARLKKTKTQTNHRERGSIRKHFVVRIQHTTTSQNEMLVLLHAALAIVLFLAGATAAFGLGPSPSPPVRKRQGQYAATS